MLAYSVLMPVYAKENPDFLNQAIGSILNQSVKAAEIVIVCDGPLTKDLDSVLERYEESYAGVFRIIRFSSNVGLGRALNKGICQCHNEIVARMDSDDISVPGRMEKQLKAFESNAELSLCSGSIAEFMFDPNDIVSYRHLPCTYEEILKYSKKRNPMNHMAVMYRKSKVLEAGNYQEIKGFEDYYLWVRMLQKGCKAENINEVLVLARIGNGMFERRGGMKYFTGILELERSLVKIGYLNYAEFARNMAVRGIVSLVPKKFRALFYKKILR